MQHTDESLSIARWLVPALLFCSVALPAAAAIDKFDARHISGACADARFATGFFLWPNRQRISIATGERISVRLYGDMAEKAEDAVGADIFEWIESRGYGWVDVHIRAASEHGTGNRTVTVKWPGWMGGGTESIPLRIVSNCSSLFGPPYRISAPNAPTGSVSNINPINSAAPTVSVPVVANLLPSLDPSYLLARPLGITVATPAGGMFPVNAAFCANLPPNVATQVSVPPLRWGVVGVNIELAAAGFETRLYNVSNPNAAPALLATLPLPAGFPANTPLVHATNYPGRPTTLRVIANPQFVISGSTSQTYPGCFTAPGVTQPLDPVALRIVVDPLGTVAEGANENDNTLNF